MISLADINLAYRNASETEKNEFIELILPKVIESTIFESKVTVIIEKILKESFDARLAVSELRPIKRIAELELVTGLENYYEDEDHEPTLPERILDFEKKFDNLELRPTVSHSFEIKPETKTEMRANLLVNALEASGKDHFTANEIIDFLKCKLPENCKIDSTVKNIRKVKQDVVKTASEMFENVFLSKKSTGHREVRLILRS